jgi:ribosome-associated toxin RatA of RatAB toxin-antitoxin module
MRVFLVLLLCLLGMPLLAGAAGPPALVLPAGETLARLLAGEVDISTGTEGGAAAASLQAVFYTSAESVWRTLESCEANFSFVPGLRECQLLELEERRAVTRQVVKSFWFMPSTEFTFATVRQPYEWIVIQLLGGDLRQMQGSWRFDPLPGHPGALLVSHSIRLEPRAVAPGWMVRNTLRKDLPDMLACLRWVSGGSGEPAQAQRDQQRCAGPARRDGARDDQG